MIYVLKNIGQIQLLEKIKKSQLNKDLNEFDQIILDLFKVCFRENVFGKKRILFVDRKMQENQRESHDAIIVNNEGQIPLVGCRDYRTEHPLQHSTMVAIDYLSSNSIYLTHEPCVMCTMALIHS
jgi:hypothetical protein